MRRPLAIVALPVALAVSLVSCGNPDPVASPSVVETPTTPAAPTPTQTATQPTEPTEPASSEPPAPAPTIDYGSEGIEVVEPGDVALLEGAPEDFKAFAARLARQLTQEGEQCPGAFHGVTVLRLTGDFGLGGVNACGGYTALWQRGDSGWAEILGTQEAPSCADLAAHDVPEGFVDCV